MSASQQWGETSSTFSLLHERTGVEPVGCSKLQRDIANSLRALADEVSCIEARTLETEPLSDELKHWLRAASTLVNLAEQLGSSKRTRFPSLSVYPMGTHPIFGIGNPLAPPLSLDVDGEANRVSARCVYGPSSEGIPGFVFGGHVAAAFDAVLGVAAALVGGPVVARSLHVHFQDATPLQQEVVYTGNTAIEDDPGLIEVRGSLRNAAGTETATAQATFERLTPTRFVRQ